MKTAKWDKPLSKRAYEKIKERALVGVTIAGREDDFEEFIETIDLYISKGKISMPWCDHHDIYEIIFHMIKDDIDTAIRRSREARERAAARRRVRDEASEKQAEGNDGFEMVGAICPDRVNPTTHEESGQAKKSRRRDKVRRYNERC